MFLFVIDYYVGQGGKDEGSLFDCCVIILNLSSMRWKSLSAMAILTWILSCYTVVVSFSIEYMDILRCYTDTEGFL